MQRLFARQSTYIWVHLKKTISRDPYRKTLDRLCAREDFGKESDQEVKWFLPRALERRVLLKKGAEKIHLHYIFISYVS